MDENTDIIVRKCPYCKTLRELVVPASAYEAWRSGTFIQDAFPMLSADDREFLMTGICPPCWDKAFPDD